MSNKLLKAIKLKNDYDSSYITYMIIKKAGSLGYGIDQSIDNIKFHSFNDLDFYSFKHFYFKNDGMMSFDNNASSKDFDECKFEHHTIDSFMKLETAIGKRQVHRYRFWMKDGLVFETSHFLYIEDNVFYRANGTRLHLNSKFDDIISKYETIDPSIDL